MHLDKRGRAKLPLLQDFEAHRTALRAGKLAHSSYVH
jgi:hypothetical protein